MRRYLPSMSSLRVFEASARRNSFSRAAEELHLTQSAVSRQIMTLEAMLKTRLFSRSRQRIELTPAGAVYLPEVRACLSRLEAATLELMSHHGRGGILNLAVLPTFATRWLIPRFESFAEAHPKVVVNFSAQISNADFVAARIDAAIQLGEPGDEDLIAHRLFGEEAIPVCAPALQRRTKLRTPSDLASATRLHLMTRPDGWLDWFEAVGEPSPVAGVGPRFEHFAMMIQAAVAGLGVALVPRFLVEAELEKGTLVVPIDVGVPSRYGYCLVYPRDKQTLPALKVFTEWLLHEAAAADLGRARGARSVVSAQPTD
jgi:LysR family transcriptional regulator, glycine cleavage system transcriptional activator